MGISHCHSTLDTNDKKETVHHKHTRLYRAADDYFGSYSFGFCFIPAELWASSGSTVNLYKPLCF